MSIYAGGSLSIIGIVFNLVSVFVLGCDRVIKQTTRFLLQTLAVADTIFLVCCLVRLTLTSVVYSTDLLAATDFEVTWWAYFDVYSGPAWYIAQSVCNWTVVVITIERYVAVCWPLQAADYSTTARVRAAVAVVWIGSAVFCVPRFFEYGVEVAVDGTTNASVYYSEPNDDLWNSAAYVSVYGTWLYNIVTILLPMFSLAFINHRLVGVVRRSHEQLQQQLPSSSRAEAAAARNERSCTLMLIVVVVVFIVCQLPNVLRQGLKLVVDRFFWDRWEKANGCLVAADQIALVSANFMFVVNSSVNFFIYVFMHRYFRRTLQSAVFCCRRTEGIVQQQQ